jgi:polyferredoxin
MTDRSPVPRRQDVSLTVVTLILIVFVAAGSVIVYYVWEGINELLAGQIVPSHLLLGVVALIAFVGFLMLLSRYIKRVETASHTPPTAESTRTSHDAGG